VGRCWVLDRGRGRRGLGRRGGGRLGGGRRRRRRRRRGGGRGGRRGRRRAERRLPVGPGDVGLRLDLAQGDQRGLRLGGAGLDRVALVVTGDDGVGEDDRADQKRDSGDAADDGS